MAMTPQKNIGAIIVAIGLIAVIVVIVVGLFSKPSYNTSLMERGVDPQQKISERSLQSRGGELQANMDALFQVPGLQLARPPNPQQFAPPPNPNRMPYPAVTQMGGMDRQPVSVRNRVQPLEPQFRGEMQSNRRQKTASTPDPAALKAYIAPNIQMSEAHWQGLEALPLSKELKKKLKLPKNLRGVLVDEVTLNAAASGVMAGDVLLAINSRPTHSLEQVVSESKRIQMRQSATLTVYRKKRMHVFTMTARGNLGFAQVESAPMILPGEIMPHPYRGACTTCHPVGTTGHIVPDPDGVILPPPPISAKAKRPHRDHGPCRACHVIVN
ncbi:magnetochrome domain-containing protein [Magnetococcales bacterium HHB-1]